MILMKQHSIHKIRHSWNIRAWQEKCANSSIWSKYDKRPDVSQLRVAWRNPERCLICATCKLTSILSQADDQNGYSVALNKKKIVIHSFRTNMFDLFSNG
jgi:hypothetical protein